MKKSAESKTNWEPTEPQTVARFLGRVEVRCAAVRVDLSLPPQALLLLVLMLVRNGETLRRDESAFTLWPDTTEADARAMLRRNLYTIQKSLPQRAVPWIRSDSKTIAWAPGPGSTWVDVTEFEHMSESPDTLDQAVRLYRGDFAPNIDHEWATTVRERLRGRSKWALEELIAQYTARHDVRNALQYSEQLLEQDPWREDALCSTMLLRYRLGDRAGAMYSYRTFRGRLHAEFGVDPMPETERCYCAISAGASIDSARQHLADSGRRRLLRDAS